MQPLVVEDKKVTNMPAIRINANRTMQKYRMKQEEIENQKQRLKQVDVSEYLRRSQFKIDEVKVASGLYEAASSHFPFNKDNAQLRQIYKNLHEVQLK